MKENTTYRARYQIQHGLTHGFGIVYPDESMETREFQAADTEGALEQAIKQATEMAMNFIPHPNTGTTKVQIIELYEKGSKAIDIRAEMQKRIPAERWEHVKSLLFPDGTHYVTERSWIEHALALEAIEKKIKKQG